MTAFRSWAVIALRTSASICPRFAAVAYAPREPACPTIAVARAALGVSDATAQAQATTSAAARLRPIPVLGPMTAPSSLRARSAWHDLSIVTLLVTL